MYAVHHFLYMKPHDPSAEGGLSLLKGADAAALPFGCPRLRFVLRSTFLLENFVRFQFLHLNFTIQLCYLQTLLRPRFMPFGGWDHRNPPKVSSQQAVLNVAFVSSPADKLKSRSGSS